LGWGRQLWRGRRRRSTATWRSDYRALSRPPPLPVDPVPPSKNGKKEMNSLTTVGGTVVESNADVVDHPRGRLSLPSTSFAPPHDSTIVPSEDATPAAAVATATTSSSSSSSWADATWYASESASFASVVDGGTVAGRGSSVVDGAYEKDDENDDNGGDRRRRTAPEESFAVEGVDVDDAWTAASPSIVMCIDGVFRITWNVLIPT
jgi:hypothetical protein